MSRSFLRNPKFDKVGGCGHLYFHSCERTANLLICRVFYREAVPRSGVLSLAGLGFAMTLDGALMTSVDLTALSLDTALELDRLARNKTADLKTIEAFGDCLGSSPSNASSNQRLYCLQENPLNVDILNSALYRSEGPALVNIDDLDARLRELISRLKEVASGVSKDATIIAGLKRFCLSLHTALLDEITPKVDRDEWMSAHQDFKIA